jgi:two-component system, cell cycle sensor histidine kinase and response regulator CckA
MPLKATLQELLYTDHRRASIELIQAVLRQNTGWQGPPLVRRGAETPTSWCSAGAFAPASRLDVEWLLMQVPEVDWHEVYSASNADARLHLFPEAFWSAPPSYSETRPLRVLLVEDSPTDRLLLQEMLKTSKSVLFQVTHVEYLSEALQQLAAERFDVVLLDLSLPDSLGLETFTVLHAQALAVPVVVLTGLNDETLAVEAVREGAQDYLVKGQLEGHLLVRAIRYAIERKRAEEALRQQRDWFKVTLSSIGDAVIATDTQGTIIFTNPVAARLTGWPSHEAVGRHIHEVFCIIDAQTRQAVENPVMQVLREGTMVALDHHTALMARDGSEVPIADSGALIRSDDGTLHGVVLVFRDISERKRLEEQLRQAQKMEAIGTLAGGIAHDFNNMLQAILGYTELALGGVPPTSVEQQHLYQVRTAGIRARDLVQRILTFSRRTTATYHPVYLHVLVQEALTLLRASLPSTIEIRQHLAQDAGAVLADATQMHQILMNLCANAEYAMRQTGGVLEVHLEAVEVEATGLGAALDLSPGPYVRLTIRDTGPGIAPDVRPRIFEPFFTTKKPSEGTGMGLSVVHGIVASHGGAIAVTSAPGQGPTFEVYLPRFSATPTAPAAPTEALPLRGKGCVLLVEDEIMLARVGQAHLEALNYEVVPCLSSVEALETFRAAPQRFDLVITDQTMPQMTGDALAQALRRIRPDIPIILCTGFSHIIDAERAKALEINAWLAKPWEAREFARTIQEVLEQQRREEG